METDSNQEPEKASKTYGKRPVWQWVAIYLIMAIVVYGLVYVLFMRDSGATGGLGY